MFKNMGGNIPGGNFSGRNFPGGSLMGGNFPVGNFPGGSFPDSDTDTYFENIQTILIFLKYYCCVSHLKYYKIFFFMNN